jgi:hypothetical protein
MEKGSPGERRALKDYRFGLGNVGHFLVMIAVRILHVRVLHMSFLRMGVLHRGARRRLDRALLEALHGFLGRRTGHFALKFILGLGKFLHRLAETASEFRQLLGAEKEEDNNENDEEIRSSEV